MKAPADLPQFDRLLLDVPCSGFGVLSKRADLRWRRSPQDLEAIVKAQVRHAVALYQQQPSARIARLTCVCDILHSAM